MITSSLINEFTTRTYRKLRMIWRWFSSFYFSLLKNNKYSKFKTFCLFIGYPRSGHTLIASLLNAHPNIVIGIELNVIVYSNLGFNRNQIIYSLIENSKYYSKKLGNVWTDYNYKVENSFQGTFKHLRIIGDKFASGTTKILRENKDALTQLDQKMDIPLKLIHIIRNPFDVISTMMQKELMKLNMENPSNLDLLAFIKSFFEDAEVIDNLKSDGHYDIKDIYYEDFLLNPENILEGLVNFLGETCTYEYLNNCSKIIYKTPHKSRFEFNWSHDLINFVQKEISRYEFFKGYSYYE